MSIIPYWDMHDLDEFPAGINADFHMNCQSLISLHEFTAENGATAIVPNSQKTGIYPSKEAFNDAFIQLSCPPGSLLLFTGLVWHCSMPNNSDGERTSVLGQYLPKFVKPMEDLKRGVATHVVEAASPALASTPWHEICAIRNWRRPLRAMRKANQPLSKFHPPFEIDLCYFGND